MRYIVGPDYSVEKDGGLVRLYHKGTIEVRDVGIAETETETVSVPEATPVRATSRSDRHRSALRKLRHLRPQPIVEPPVSFGVKAGITVIGLLTTLSVYVAYLFSPFAG